MIAQAKREALGAIVQAFAHKRPLEERKAAIEKAIVAFATPGEIRTACGGREALDGFFSELDRAKLTARC